MDENKIRNQSVERVETEEERIARETDECWAAYEQMQKEEEAIKARYEEEVAQYLSEDNQSSDISDTTDDNNSSGDNTAVGVEVSDDGDVADDDVETKDVVIVKNKEARRNRRKNARSEKRRAKEAATVSSKNLRKRKEDAGVSRQMSGKPAPAVQKCKELVSIAEKRCLLET